MARPTMTLEHEMLDDLPPEPPALGELAKLDTNLTITQERNLFGDIVTAQATMVKRDEARLLKKMDVLGARNGSRFFYRYPVKNRRTRQVEYIEGPTIKCTDAVYMAYMNANVESRTVAIPGDKGGNYICYSRFSDYEQGVSLTMGQLVPRSATLGGEDEERRQQIAHNVGQSKSRRNCVNAALGEYVNRAYEAAKRSLIERIGRNIDKSREVIAARIEELGVAGLTGRVEHLYGRKIKDFLATDIASVYAELQAIKDGMASIDEQWPLPAPPEPRRGDPETPAAATSPPAADPTAAPAATGAAATSTSPTTPAHGSAPPPATPEVPKPDTSPGERTEGSTTDEPSTPPTPRNWTIPPDVMGQEAIIRALGELLDMTESDADQDEFERQNAERIAKITGVKGQQLRAQFAAKRRARQGGG